MRYFHRFHLLFLPLLVFVISGCSPRPTAQIERAQKAMDQAKAEHAETFAGEEWSTANAAWQEAQERLDAKKFTEAIPKLLKAQQGFQKARDIAEGRREAAITQIKGDQKASELRCKMLKDNLAAAKKLRADRKKELESACAGVEEKIAKITTLLDQANYNEAKNLASSTLREVYEAEVKLKGYTSGK